jgi:hypothetical protein
MQALQSAASGCVSSSGAADEGVTMCPSLSEDNFHHISSLVIFRHHRLRFVFTANQVLPRFSMSHLCRFLYTGHAPVLQAVVDSSITRSELTRTSCANYVGCAQFSMRSHDRSFSSYASAVIVVAVIHFLNHESLNDANRFLLPNHEILFFLNFQKMRFQYSL